MVHRPPSRECAWSFVLNSDNGDYTFSSGQLEGENSQRVFPVCTQSNPRPCYRRVRPGEYVFEACVYRTNKKRFCDRIALTVH